MFCFELILNSLHVSNIVFILIMIMSFLIFIKRIAFSLLHSVLCFIMIVVYFGTEYQIWDYIQISKNTKENKFYENNYIDPRNAEIIEPQEKKNLIIISLESMEFTFANLDKNYIPELSKLAEDNISFTNYKNGYAMDNTQTSMIATLCGIPSAYIAHFSVKEISNISNSLFSSMSRICPNAYSISQILKNYGYTLAQFQGNDNTFANNKIFLELHGFDIIEGLNELKIHPLCEKTIHGWHISDSNLFDILKDKVTFLSQKQPFFLYCNTNDTHFTSKETVQSVNKNFQQASQMTFDFVQWIQEQDFGSNTVIIIVGDHLRMGQLFREITNRTIYNVFINSQATPPTKDRTFWAMDLCPTILEALGFKLKNPRLGLGVSLFSSEPTLLESMGQEKLTNELRKNNEFYNSLWQ